jgi:superfamily II DNA helicase RecQ
MISFLNNTEECLNKTLLNYFDEEAPNRCNHCANCKEQNNWSIKPKQLREQITVIIKAHGSLSLNELLHLTGASNSVTTQLIRTMIDERTLCINDDGNICLLSD